MNDELQEGPRSPVAPAASPASSLPNSGLPKSNPPKPKKLTRREARRRRRQRRRRGEEMLAWVLVPLICFGLYWGVAAGFDFFGTSPGQVWDQLMQVKAMMEKRSAGQAAPG